MKGSCTGKEKGYPGKQNINDASALVRFVAYLESYFLNMSALAGFSRGMQTLRVLRSACGSTRLRGVVHKHYSAHGRWMQRAHMGGHIDLDAIYNSAANTLEDRSSKPDQRDWAIEDIVHLVDNHSAGSPSQWPLPVVKAAARLGRWCLFGICGQAKDVRKAVILLTQAAIAGDTDAMYWLGHAYMNMPATPSQHNNVEMNSPKQSSNQSVMSDADRVDAAKRVIAEIRSLRKVAKQNKVRKVQGLPLLPYTTQATGTAGNSLLSSDEAALRSAADDALVADTSKARYWLTKVLQDLQQICVLSA
jgi:TPR repeat protein